MKPVESLSEVQIRDLLKYFEDRCGPKLNGLRDYLIVSLMLHCGLRVGETVQLTWDMLTLEGMPLECVNLDGSITKSGVARAVPMPVIVRGALIQYMKLGFSGDFLVAGFVFPTPRHPGFHLNVRSVQLFINAASKNAIGCEITPHTLRHTYATRMMKLTDIPTLQRLMGHASIKSTQIYTHPSNEDMLTAAKKLDILNKDL